MIILFHNHDKERYTQCKDKIDAFCTSTIWEVLGLFIYLFINIKVSSSSEESLLLSKNSDESKTVWIMPEPAMKFGDYYVKNYLNTMCFRKFLSEKGTS